MRQTAPTFVWGPGVLNLLFCDQISRPTSTFLPLVLLNRKGILAGFQLDMENLEQVGWTEMSENQIPAVKEQDLHQWP